ncbi:tetratricopeptide repeat protein [Pseudonocardia humida]|uniref:Tetratricopeptide repeat protein n=1 Tax=Pseudonocardia humida TaxID=2800819 RepID=A0ABT1A1D3_9PSEU|nr:tetratricopeptide repeat protein [Pseudonocardia humida]MCO1656699.1 tetratricopeptide repeat protein [Pseudonocardia humida]
MDGIEADVERRLVELWAGIDDHEEADFRARIDEAVAALRADHPVALFERACANDSTGRPDHAAPLYREAIAAGLTGIRRRRAVIQLASSLRNLGRARESVELLTAERERGSDELDDAVTAFLALALVDTGRPREAAGLALGALAPHLPRYTRSLAAYAADLRSG